MLDLSSTLQVLLIIVVACFLIVCLGAVFGFAQTQYLIEALVGMGGVGACIGFGIILVEA